MTTVVVERWFGKSVPLDEIEAIYDRGAACLEMYGVHLLRSFISNDRSRMICLYEAQDADSVRQAQRKAGLPFEAVWVATIIEP